MAVETVHFRKELVQGLFALVVASAQAAVPAFANGVDLIDEDDAGGVLLGFLEQVADTGCSHADEHFYEIRAGQGEERYVRLSCYGFGQQCFSGSRRAYEQCSFGELGSDLGVFARIMEEVYDFLQRFFGLFFSGYIFEGDAGVFFDVDFCFAFTDVHAHHAASAAHSAHEQGECAPQQ